MLLAPFEATRYVQSAASKNRKTARSEVLAAHRANPDASNLQLAHITGYHPNTVAKHRPPRTAQHPTPIPPGSAAGAYTAPHNTDLTLQNKTGPSAEISELLATAGESISPTDSADRHTDETRPPRYHPGAYNPGLSNPDSDGKSFAVGHRDHSTTIAIRPFKSRTAAYYAACDPLTTLRDTAVDALTRNALSHIRKVWPGPNISDPDGDPHRTPVRPRGTRHARTVQPAAERDRHLPASAAVLERLARPRNHSVQRRHQRSARA